MTSVNLSLLAIIWITLTSSSHFGLAIQNTYGDCPRAKRHDEKSTVVGGRNALPHEFPWLLLIFIKIGKGHFTCGGSIMDAHYVLSAARCFYNEGTKKAFEAKDIFVVAGLNNANLDLEENMRQTRQVAEVIMPRKYIRLQADNDIALLKTVKPFTFNTYVYPICLTATTVKAHTRCQVAGWSKTLQVEKNAARMLQTITVPILEESECGRSDDHNYQLEPYEVCAGYPERGKKDTHPGDSGGPLMCKIDGYWIQVGIVSYGVGRARGNKPSVFTDVAHTSSNEFVLNYVDLAMKPLHVDYDTSHGKNAKALTVNKIRTYGRCPKAKMDSQRMVGDHNPQPHEFPWQLFIYIRIGTSSFICGGSILNAQYVLSAASCFYDKKKKKRLDVEDIFVIAGVHDFRVKEKSRQYKQVAVLIMPSRYVGLQTDNDIALLKLVTPFTFNNYVYPICLSESRLKADTPCQVTGWGSKMEGGIPVKVQQTITVPLIADSVCGRTDVIGYNLKPYEMCAGHLEGGREVCQGASGGPLMCKIDQHWIQVGIASYGMGCGRKNKPAVYTDVSQSRSMEFVLNYVELEKPPKE